MSNLVLGIDLGTTNSVAHIWDDNKYISIQNDKSNLFPSIVEFTDKGKIICNEKYNINNCIRNIKRFIGYDVDDINILNFLSNLNFTHELVDNKIKIFNKFENKYYTLEELNALILKKIITKANKQLNTNINDVIITIPTHFNQNQRDSVLLSTKLANLNCIRIINEPTAAALAYGLTYHNDVNILIFDLGGGTFDLSILNIDDGIYEVLNTQGDNLLGGQDFTKLILNDVINEFKIKNKFYILDDDIININMHDLLDMCEQFKCNKIDSIEINNFYNDNKNNIILNLKYTKKRNEIGSLFNSLLIRIEDILNIILSSANISKNEINYIILVGGSTKLPEVRNMVSLFFEKELLCNLDPELVVSIGAAIQGYILNNSDSNFSQNLALIDIMPLSIGIESDDGQMTKIINKGTKLPIKKFKLFSNEEDNQQEVDIKVYQGERNLVKDNIMIGNFKLSNLKMKKKNTNIIRVEMRVDNNCMISITESEKGSNNNNTEITIKKDNKLFDEKLIKKMIEESSKYEEIDRLKCKFFKLNQKLEREINNLEYNCYENEYINFNNDEKNNLDDYIKNIKIKKDIIMNKIQNNDLINKDYLDGINNFKKLLKINSKKYSMLIITYNNEKNKEIVLDINQELHQRVYIDSLDKKLNNDLSNIINDNIKIINSSNKISKYSKDLIIKYLQNLIFKLESLVLDNELYEDYIKKININIESYIKNDISVINLYGNLESIKKVFEKNKISYDINNFINLNQIEIFNLLFDICQKFNVRIN